MATSNSRGAPRQMGGNGGTVGKCADRDCKAGATHTYQSKAGRTYGFPRVPVCDDHAESIRKMQAYMRADGRPDTDFDVRPIEVA
jgi:hypothetical protein